MNVNLNLGHIRTLCPAWPEMCSTVDCLSCYLANLESRLEGLERLRSSPSPEPSIVRLTPSLPLPPISWGDEWICVSVDSVGIAGAHSGTVWRRWLQQEEVNRMFDFPKYAVRFPLKGLPRIGDEPR